MVAQTYDKGDVLPEDYKKALIRLMAFQADSEYALAQRLTENQRFLTRHEEGYRLAKKIHEEIGHANAIWSLLEDLGIDADARLAELVQHPDDPDPAKVSILNAFRRENWTPLFECWEDVALFSLVVTPATVIYLDQYQNCSYLPWARVNVRAHKEEHGHLAFGTWATERCLKFGGARAREFMQNRVPRLMGLGLGFFGRPATGKDCSHSFETYRKFGLKVRRPEEQQQEYLDMMEKRLRDAGLAMPADIEPNYLARGRGCRAAA